MESRDTWGPLEHAISIAIHRAQDARARGVIGLSMVRQIADELRSQGLVKEEVNNEGTT